MSPARTLHFIQTHVQWIKTKIFTSSSLQKNFGTRLMSKYQDNPCLAILISKNQNNPCLAIFISIDQDDPCLAKFISKYQDYPCLAIYSYQNTETINAWQIITMPKTTIVWQTFYSKPITNDTWRLLLFILHYNPIEISYLNYNLPSYYSKPMAIIFFYKPMAIIY